MSIIGQGNEEKERSFFDEEIIRWERSDGKEKTKSLLGKT